MSTTTSSRSLEDEELIKSLKKSIMDLGGQLISVKKKNKKLKNDLKASEDDLMYLSRRFQTYEGGNNKSPSSLLYGSSTSLFSDKDYNGTNNNNNDESNDNNNNNNNVHNISYCEEALDDNIDINNTEVYDRLCDNEQLEMLLGETKVRLKGIKQENNNLRDENKILNDKLHKSQLLIDELKQEKQYHYAKSLEFQNLLEENKKKDKNNVNSNNNNINNNMKESPITIRRNKELSINNNENKLYNFNDDDSSTSSTTNSNSNLLNEVREALHAKSIECVTVKTDLRIALEQLDATKLLVEKLQEETGLTTKIINNNNNNNNNNQENNEKKKQGRNNNKKNNNKGKEKEEEEDNETIEFLEERYKSLQDERTRCVEKSVFLSEVIANIKEQIDSKYHDEMMT